DEQEELPGLDDVRQRPGLLREREVDDRLVVRGVALEPVDESPLLLARERRVLLRQLWEFAARLELLPHLVEDRPRRRLAADPRDADPDDRDARRLLLAEIVDVGLVPLAQLLRPNVHVLARTLARLPRVVVRELRPPECLADVLLG